MSTRSFWYVKGESGESGEEAHVFYRHWDGCPSEALSDLKEALYLWLEFAEDDPDHRSANEFTALLREVMSESITQDIFGGKTAKHNDEAIDALFDTYPYLEWVYVIDLDHHFVAVYNDQTTDARKQWYGCVVDMTSESLHMAIEETKQQNIW